MTTSLTTSLQGTPIDGAVALVTGGHRGFGRALVDELLGVDCLTGRKRRTALVEAHAALAERSGRSWPAGRSVSKV